LRAGGRKANPSSLGKPKTKTSLIDGTSVTTLAKRAFTIDTGKEQIEVEGHEHRNVAVKYLMKRRRSLLSTKDPAKVEKMYTELPSEVKIIGKQLTKAYKVAWEKKGTGEFVGARFTFDMTEA
jgi:hypothetical protein